ncbi:MAG: NAD kinase [Brachymonas sp.]|nr:NAD kinase [Brachymonas sp.]
MPAQAFQHVALIGKHLPKNGAEGVPAAQAAALPPGVVRHVAQCIEQAGCKVSLETGIARHTGLDQDYPVLGLKDMAKHCDVAVVVGGDGTMLNTARQLAGHLPLIGINQGRLGFMTDIALEQVGNVLPPMLQGNYSEDARHLLHATVLSNDEVVFESLALNDVTINRESTSGMIELRVEVDGHFVYNQRADGLIVATSTGSTAYALSAGGALMHPSVAGWILVPIAPHTLSNRPIVINEKSRISIEVVNPRDATANFDAQAHYAPLRQGQRVEIGRSRQAARFLHPLHWNYFDTLREKLHWNKGSA